ncbi:Arf-GAP domain and FG repeat-containing protein 2 [Lemmus lemmus]
MVMAAKKGPGPGGGVGGSKAEAEAASEVWCRRVRELGGCSQAGNRHCFECAQRGVTYVDITVGSFVCTTCSGLLPAHRRDTVKRTLLGEATIKTLTLVTVLSHRYVPPEQVKGPCYSKGGASTPVQGSGPEGKPVRTLLGEPVPSLSDAASSLSQSQARTAQARSSQPPSQSSTKKASTDLLADIGGDPFAAPQVAPAFATFPAFGGQTPSHGGFANFDAFSSSPGTSAFGSLPPSVQTPFQAQPGPAGSSQMSAFGAAPIAAGTQPSSLADVGGLLGPRVAAGGLPGSVFGIPSQVPALQSSVPGVSSNAAVTFGASPRLRELRPSFFSKLSAVWPGFGMSSVGPGLLQPVPPTGAFASPFPAQMFPTQAVLTEHQNGSSFGDLGTSKLGQRPLNQATGISTNPFMVSTTLRHQKHVVVRS